MGSSTMERQGSRTGTGAQPNAEVETMDLKQVKSIQLADGWHDVSDVQRVHFAVGEAQSPITPDKLYPYLRYTNENGKPARTSIRNVLSFSEEPQNR